MSFSTSFTSPTKADAKAELKARLDSQLNHQPAHNLDRNIIETAAVAYIDALEDQDVQDISVSINGYVAWQQVVSEGEAPTALTGSNLTINVTLTARASDLSNDHTA